MRHMTTDTQGRPRTDGTRQPRTKEVTDLIRKARAVRKARGLSLADVERECGYYSKSMIGLLERSLSPGAPKPSMSRRGMESLRAWVASCESGR